MKQLLIIAVLVAITVLQQGCGVVKGVGMGIGSLCEGIGHVGTGIKHDMVSGSDGYNRDYHNKHNR